MCQFCRNIKKENPTTSQSLKVKWSIETGKTIPYETWLEEQVINSENDIQRTDQFNEDFQKVLTDELNKYED